MELLRKMLFCIYITIIQTSFFGFIDSLDLKIVNEGK